MLRKKKLNVVKKIVSISVISLILLLSVFAYAEEGNVSEASVLTKEDQEEIALAGNAKTYNARIMQGNTNEEEDCLATHNGLTDSGSYVEPYIIETGWTFNSSTS